MKRDRDGMREALRRADGDLRPDVSRLIDAVPSLMLEAERRRSSAPDLTSLLAARSWHVVPRLALAAAAAVVLAVVTMTLGDVASKPASSTFEGVVLGGHASGGAGTGDVLFEAVLGAGRHDG